MRNTENIAASLLICLAIAGCGGGGDGSPPPSAPPVVNYDPLTTTEANAWVADDSGRTVSFQLAHTDGLNNSVLGIADINVVMLYRNSTDGSLYVAYDVLILDPATWGGLIKFRLYIDNDGSAATGEPQNGIGADLYLTPTSQYMWNSTGGTWDSTWFESAPPPGGIRVSGIGGASWTWLSATPETQFRVYEQLRYLDALTIGPSARAVLQIRYAVWDGLYFVDTLLDQTAPFDLPSL